MTAWWWAWSRHVKLGLDVAAWSLTIPLAFVLRMDFGALRHVDSILALAALALPVQAAFAYGFGLHRQSWGVVSGPDMKRVIAAVVLATPIVLVEAWWLQSYMPAPRSVALISGALALIALSGMRLGVRWIREHRRRARTGSAKRVLVVGAGETGTSVARDLLARPEGGLVPVGFLDDDPGIQGLSRIGLPVLGPLADLPRVARSHRVDEALFAIPDASMGLRRRTFELAEKSGVPLRSVPDIQDLVSPHEREVRSVLVIGGAGYIGSALVPRLLERGYRVRVLDLLIYGDEPIRPYMEHPDFTLVQGDFRQVDKVVEALQGVDTVVHLGGLVGDPACALDEDLTVEINLMATKMIAEVAKGYGVSRFVFASTCSVYGENDGILTEESGLNPLSLYARTKVASERVLLKLKDKHFSPVILRFGTVYGFSGRTRFDLVVNLLTAKAVQENVITLYGGDQWRPFVHVQDVAKAVDIVTSAPLAKVGGRILNVGSDEQNKTLEQVARLVQDAVPTAQIVDKGANADKRNYRVGFRAIREELGFTPDWTIEMGIRQVVDAIRSSRVKDYRIPIYSNVLYLTDEGLNKLVRRELMSPLDELEKGA